MQLEVTCHIVVVLFAPLLLPLVVATKEDQAAASTSTPAARPPAKVEGRIELSRGQGDTYDCQLNYPSLPKSYIRLALYRLERKEGSAKRGEKVGWDNFLSRSNSSRKNDQDDDDDEDLWQLKGLECCGLGRADFEGFGLNPNLPFLFFANGFNSDGKVKGTWMYRTALLLGRLNESRRRERMSSAEGNQNSSLAESNVILLSWHIMSLTTDSILSVFPTYYKTMANYDTVVEYFRQTLSSLIDFIEQSHEPWKSSEARSSFYSKFRFYGHSLGTHILADAISQVQLNRSDMVGVQLGKLVGLDPPHVCFSNPDHGISSEKMAASTTELAIIHSNAGFTGTPAHRAEVEIVLNGGTFQPTCSWFDPYCNHMVATEMFNYSDDNCQMVAYKCTAYEQFKVGACELDSDLDNNQQKQQPDGAKFSRYTLVNLIEQHSDSYQLELLNDNDPTRQLADNYDYDLYDGDSSIRNSSEGRVVGFDGGNFSVNNSGEFFDGAKSSPFQFGISSVHNDHRKQVHDDNSTTSKQLSSPFLLKDTNKELSYYYVSTNPNYGHGTDTHCLQHYQMRLLMLTSNKSLSDSFCPIGSFTSSPGIEVRLFYDSQYKGQNEASPSQASNKQQQQQQKAYTDRTMVPIIPNRLYTNLLRFAGPTRLFLEAHVSGIDLEGLSKCIINHDKEIDSFRFILDVAFMSNMNRKRDIKNFLHLVVDDILSKFIDRFV